MTEPPRHPLKIQGVLWVAVFATLVTVPLLILGSGLVGVDGVGWWFDFAMGLGFAALALLAGQFLLTARLRRATAPFGVDLMYLVHRWLAVIGVLLVLGHYAVLRIRYPATLTPAWPGSAPGYMTAGRAALLLFLLLIVSSLWRKVLRIEYDRWRRGHIFLAVGAIALSFIHVRGVGYYSGSFWSRLLLDLLLGSLIAIVTYVRLVKPILSSGRPYRVREVRPERGRAWTLVLEPEGHDGLAFHPGQFAWLSLGRSPLHADEHPFSFSGSSERPALAFTIKELGDFTRTISGTAPGTIAYLDGPHGAFTIDRYREAPGFLLVAGGIGIAPIMSILRSLADRGDRRPLWLVYGSRTWEAITFREELEGLTRLLDLRLTHVLQEPHPGWEGAVGLPGVGVLGPVLSEIPEGVHCFVCGPMPMTEAVERALVGLGVPVGHVHSELFDMA